MRIVERNTATNLQNRINHTLGQARLVAVRVGRAQPLLIVEQTIALRQRKTSHFRFADHNVRHHRNGHLLTRLNDHRAVRRLRKVLRLVNDDADAVKVSAWRDVRIGLDIQQHREADMLTVAGHSIDGLVQLIGHRVAVVLTRIAKWLSTIMLRPRHQFEPHISKYDLTAF